jgi:hypothetical protein
VTAAPTPPTQITSSLTAAAQVGTPFTYAITSSGGTTPITYSANPLPAGLSVDPDSGVLSGIPAATGDTNIAIGAGNSAGHISATLTLSVMETAPVISIDSWRLANFGASATDPSVAGDMADPDSDGYTNLDEYNFGSQPLNPASVPTALGASPPALDFGPVAVGSTAQATLTVSDTAGSSLDGTVRASGDPFVIASDTPFTLPANGSTDIVVSFTPQVAGAFTGQVTFTSNGGSATVDVTGTGIAPAAAGVKQGLRP